MEPELERVLLTLGVLVGLIVAASWLVEVWLLKLLRERHPRAWKELGSPTMFWHNSISNSWRFVFSRSSETLEDRQLSRLLAVRRILTLLLLVFLSAYVVIFFSILLRS